MASSSHLQQQLHQQQAIKLEPSLPGNLQSTPCISGDSSTTGTPAGPLIVTSTATSSSSSCTQVFSVTDHAYTSNTTTLSTSQTKDSANNHHLLTLQTATPQQHPVKSFSSSSNGPQAASSSSSSQGLLKAIPVQRSNQNASSSTSGGQRQNSANGHQTQLNQSGSSSASTTQLISGSPEDRRTIQQTLTNGLLDWSQSQSNAISFVCSDAESFANRAEAELNDLVKFMTSLGNDLVKFELRAMFVAMLAFVFTDLYQNGHHDMAHRIYAMSRTLYRVAPDAKMIVERMGRSIERNQLDPELGVVSCKRVALPLSLRAITMLLTYLKRQESLFLIQCISHHFDLDETEGAAPSARELLLNLFQRAAASSSGSSRESSATGQAIVVKSESQEPAMSESLSSDQNVLGVKPGQADSKPATLPPPQYTYDSLKTAIDQLRSLGPTVPTIGLLSVNTHGAARGAPCCVDLDQSSGHSPHSDWNYTAIGFESGVIRLWDMQQRTDFSRELINPIPPTGHASSQEGYKVRRDLTDISFALDDYISDSDRPELDFEDFIKESIKSTTSANSKLKKSNCVNLMGHSGPVYGVRFMPHSDLLFSVSDDTTLRAWHSQLGKCAAIYRGHNWPVTCLDCSPFSDFITTGSRDTTCKLWSSERAYPLRSLVGHELAINCVRWHQNGTYFVSGSSDSTIRLWNAQEGRVLRLLTPANSLSPQQQQNNNNSGGGAGSSSAGVGGSLSGSANSPTGAVLDLAFSPDGRLLASASEDCSVRVWDISGSRVLKEFTGGHTKPVVSLAWSADGSTLASAGLDGCLTLWNMTDLNSAPVTPTGQSSSSGSGPNQEKSSILCSFPTKTNRLLHASYFYSHSMLLAVGVANQ